jgi:hypothetical protein
MSGGIARRPKRAKPVAGPEVEPEMVEDEPEPEAGDDDAELDDETPVDADLPAEGVHPEVAEDLADPEEHFVADGDVAPNQTRGTDD